MDIMIIMKKKNMHFQMKPTIKAGAECNTRMSVTGQVFAVVSGNT